MTHAKLVIARLGAVGWRKVEAGAWVNAGLGATVVRLWHGGWMVVLDWWTDGDHRMSPSLLEGAELAESLVALEAQK